jgi:uncharacterized protein
VLQGLPLPLADLDTKPFWDGCNEGRLLLPQCGACRTFRWPPGPMCPACQSGTTDWVEAAGTGEVYSWVIVHHAAYPALADQVPYVIALVELPEGIRILGNVAGCAPDDVRAGLSVEVVFEEIADSELLPNFQVRA